VTSPREATAYKNDLPCEQKLHRTLLRQGVMRCISYQTWRPRRFQSFLLTVQTQAGTALPGRCRKLSHSCPPTSPDSNRPCSLAKRSVSDSPSLSQPRKWFSGQRSIPNSRNSLPLVGADEDRCHRPRRWILWPLRQFPPLEKKGENCPAPKPP